MSDLLEIVGLRSGTASFTVTFSIGRSGTQTCHTILVMTEGKESVQASIPRQHMVSPCSVAARSAKSSQAVRVHCTASSVVFAYCSSHSS
jgi:hypothetical protein